MLFNKRWFASINGDVWTLAQISARRHRLKIHRLLEAEGRDLDELSKVVQTSRLKGKKLDVALACPGIITRIITLPVLKPKDLETLLTDQVDQYFTLNVDDYLIDYRILERFQEEGQSKQKVLLAAIPKYKWEEYLAIWEKVGVKPRLVDLAPDALARLYQNLSSGEENLDLAIVEINENGAQFVLLEHGVFFLYSHQDLDLSMLAELQRAPGFQPEGEPQPIPAPEREAAATNDYGLQEDIRFPNSPLDLEMTLMPLLQTLAEFNNFFAARHFGKQVDQIYLTGVYATDQIAQVLESSLNIKTTIGFPAHWQLVFGKKAAQRKAHWLKYGSLYGLAMDKVKAKAKTKMRMDFARRWQKILAKPKEASRRRRKTIALITTATLLVAMLVASPWVISRELDKRLTALDQELAQYQEVGNLLRRQEELQSLIAAREQEIAAIEAAEKHPKEILEQLGKLLPAGSVITQFDLGENTLSLMVSVQGPVDVARLWVSLRDAGLNVADLNSVSLVDSPQSLKIEIMLNNQVREDPSQEQSGIE